MACAHVRTLAHDADADCAHALGDPDCGCRPVALCPVCDARALLRGVAMLPGSTLRTLRRKARGEREGAALN